MNSGFEHTAKRYRERYGKTLYAQDYSHMEAQIRNDHIQTHLHAFRHVVECNGRLVVVVYRHGSIQTVYPPSYPIPKRIKQRFLQSKEYKQ